MVAVRRPLLPSTIATVPHLTCRMPDNRVTRFRQIFSDGWRDTDEGHMDRGKSGNPLKEALDELFTLLENTRYISTY